MANNLQGWSAHDAMKFLKQNGFSLHRSRGSHFHYKGDVGGSVRLVTVAFHGKRDIPLGTMNSMVRQ